MKRCHTPFAARGGELAHLVFLVYLVYLVCLVRRTKETRQTRASDQLVWRCRPLIQYYPLLKEPNHSTRDSQLLHASVSFLWGELRPLLSFWFSLRGSLT